MLGRFLEFGVQSQNILDSLRFYKALGFSELEIGDTWAHRYAVISDGDICIGLHGREFDSPAATFVHQELAPHARSMADHGYQFSVLRVDEDVFNELAFADRDGNAISLIEARTFSPADDDTRRSACGEFFELTLPTRDALRAGLFWAPLAPQILRVREEPTTHMRFLAGRISLGLSESIALDKPSLCFKCNNRDRLAEIIERHGLKQKKFPGFEGAYSVLHAPEGTRLYLFDEDFLGESYVVDESEETP
ncbi:MAG TPA: hypothetical protein VGA68_06690 [Woeseiaceae bacterium]|jgi:hypothetical protein